MFCIYLNCRRTIEVYDSKHKYDSINIDVNNSHIFLEEVHI